MTALGTARWCAVCGHRAYPAVVCGHGSACDYDATNCDTPPPYDPHWHCDEGCDCTFGGCLTLGEGPP